MNYIFIAVNYGTAGLIEGWVESARSQCGSSTFIIVDNFKTESESRLAAEISNTLGVHVISSENIGYGAALNLAFNFVKTSGYEGVILAGNLDVRFDRIEIKSPGSDRVFVPAVYEGKRNRNPFLTKFQRKFLALYKYPIALKSKYLFLLLVQFIRVLRLVPSDPWAIHGCVFCFDSSLLVRDTGIFNANTFLYCEELDFAEFMTRSGSTMISSDIVCRHIGAVATSEINRNIDDFLMLWRPSMINWLERWHI